MRSKSAVVRCAFYCAFGIPFHGPEEIGFLNTQIVFLRHRLRVANPLTDDVSREGCGQFRLSGRPQIVEQLRPGSQPRPPDDLLEGRAKILASIAVSRDDELATVRGNLLAIGQFSPQFREEGNHPFRLALMVRGLRRRNPDLVLVPQDIRPFERQRFRRTT